MAEGGQAASSSVLCRFDLSAMPEHVAILSGRTKDKNIGFIAEYLTNIGIDLKEVRVVADDVHLGGTLREIDHAERAIRRGRLPERPFVMAAQQFVADPQRGLSLWTYAHVPAGYRERYPGEVRELITRQVERFAPGFRDVVERVVEASPADLERWDPCLVGGDIANGAHPLIRLPHRLGAGEYLASSAAAPGAGVHGMPGWWAAEAALRDFDPGAARF